MKNLNIETAGPMSLFVAAFTVGKKANTAQEKLNNLRGTAAAFLTLAAIRAESPEHALKVKNDFYAAIRENTKSEEFPKGIAAHLGGVFNEKSKSWTVKGTARNYCSILFGESKTGAVGYGVDLGVDSGDLEGVRSFNEIRNDVEALRKLDAEAAMSGIAKLKAEAIAALNAALETVGNIDPDGDVDFSDTFLWVMHEADNIVNECAESARIAAAEAEEEEAQVA